jgi:hypothetical protein
MAWPIMVNKTSRQDAILLGTFDPLSDHAQIFEIDRSNMVLLLRSLQRAIDEGAEEMEMVAIEGVFVKSLSRALTRSARKLHLVARDLNRVLRLIERAHSPGANGRPEPKPKPRNRRN